MELLIKKLKKKIRSAIISFDKRKIFLFWAQGHVKNNWGDALNPVLVDFLSGKKSIHPNSIKNYSNKPTFLVIGSYLGNKINAKNIQIWGSGFWKEDQSLLFNPSKIFAVRGPLSRKKLINSGYDCPEVYGDPALLYPLFYYPKIDTKYEWGIIPHFRDSKSPLLKNFNHHSTLFINIEQNINDVVDQILSCKYIASSSLHGLIAADAYGLPSVWLKFPEHGVDDNFKFKDYLLSVGKNIDFMKVDQNTRISDLENNLPQQKPVLDMKKLLNSCPFLSKSVAKTVDTEKIFTRR